MLQPGIFDLDPLLFVMVIILKLGPIQVYMETCKSSSPRLSCPIELWMHVASYCIYVSASNQTGFSSDGRQTHSIRDSAVLPSNAQLDTF